MTTDTETTAEISAPSRARRAKPGLPTAATPTAPSKSDTVIKLLLRAKGATPLELIAATDWQAHSVRAFLSGLRKKGRTIIREARKTGEFAYRIEAAALPSATSPDTTSATPASGPADV